MQLLGQFLAVISGVVIHAAPVDDYIVRIENVVYEDADLQFVKDLQSGVPDVDEKKPLGKIVQVMEIQVRPGSRFYSKTTIGKKTVVLRGDLAPGDKPGWFRLDMRRECTDSTGRILFAAERRFVEDAPTTTTAICGHVELGKSTVLGPVAEATAQREERREDKRTNLRITKVRLEPVKNPN